MCYGLSKNISESLNTHLCVITESLAPSEIDSVWNERRADNQVANSDIFILASLTSSLSAIEISELISTSHKPLYTIFRYEEQTQ